MSWSVTFYSERVEAEILALPAGFLARFIRYAEKMEHYGPDLGMPHTKAMGDGLFELRLKAGEGIARFFTARLSANVSSCFINSSNRRANSGANKCGRGASPR